MSFPRSLLFLTLIFALLSVMPAIGQGGTPSFVQYGSDVQFVFNMTSGQYIRTYLPNPAGAGNMITVFIPGNSGANPTVADDAPGGSNTYNSCGSVSNGQVLWCFYAYNVKAGTRAITITVHGTTYSSSPIIAEWTHVTASTDPLEASRTAVSATSTIAAASFAPAASGDLVVQFSLNTNACCYSAGTMWAADAAAPQPNTSWNLWAAENELPVAGQWTVYSSTSALSATMRETATPAGAGASTIALFFKASAEGTPQPSGIQVVGRKTVDINAAVPWNANPRTMQVPCPAYSNLMVIDYASGGEDMTAVSSNPANTWTQTRALVGSGTPRVHNYYAANATLSPTTTVTLTFGSVSSQSAEIYCVKGAATAPLDVAAVNAAGLQTTCPGGSCNLNLVTLTPTTSNGLIIMDGSQEQNTSTQLVGSNQLWDGCLYSAESLSVSGCSQNNPFGHYLNPDTSSVNFTATQLSNSTPVQNYVAEADAFKAAGTTTLQPPTGLSATVQ